jgi:hypothetical protein
MLEIVICSELSIRRLQRSDEFLERKRATIPNDSQM